MDVIQTALSLLCEYLCANCLTINIGAVIAFILMQVMCLTEIDTLSELASHLIGIVIKETMIKLITIVKIVPLTLIPHFVSYKELFTLAHVILTTL